MSTVKNLSTGQPSRDQEYPELRSTALMTYCGKKDMKKTIEDLLKIAQGEKFGLIHHLNFKEKLQSKGLDLNRNVELLELCNPPLAKEVMETDIRVSTFLPCRISIFEHPDESGDGTVTVVQAMRPSTMSLFLGDSISKQAMHVEEIMEKIMPASLE